MTSVHWLGYALLATGKQRSLPRVRLFEHPDFDQAILRAAEHFRGEGLRPAIIEKDYYVTEALRLIAQTAGDKVIFKGGTSLSKGWNLIQRFSEDIDLFLDPRAFQPALGKNAVNRELKKLRGAVQAHPALTFLPDESKTFGGIGRNDYFSYVQRFGGVGEVVNRVLVESGTASGREPKVTVELHSYLAQFLEQTGASLGAEDEGRFPMDLLHFRRTFVEKMFTIHSKIEICKRDGSPLGGYLTAVMDWYSRYVLAWRLSNTLEGSFCLETLDEALTAKQPEIFNSDQGSQFTAAAFTGRLEKCGVAISMDGRGRALDNVFIERLWRSVKYEEVYLRDYADGWEAEQSLARYFQFYCQRRIHQALGYRTPAEVYGQATTARQVRRSNPC